MKSKLLLSAVALAFLLSFTYAFAEVPRMINYQGKLTKPQGALIDTTIAMTFAIYRDIIGTDSLWSEAQSSVVVEKGIFSVLLGSVNAIPDSVFDGSVRYLGVKVGADSEMTPRKAMVSVAYAYRAGTADAGGASSGWVDDGTVVRLQTTTDSVGIGTTDPEAKLHIAGKTMKLNNYVMNASDQDNDGDATVGSFFISPLGIEGDSIVTIGLGDPDLDPMVSHNGIHKLFVKGEAKFHGALWAWDETGIGFRDDAGNLGLWVKDGGYVGIGTTTPAQNLDVAGTAQITGFRMPTGASNGYVLTSDASGVGTWQPGAPDKDWVFPQSAGGTNPRPYLYTYGPWGIARYGNTLYGIYDSTHVNLGVACTTGNSLNNIKYCTVGGGYGNAAAWEYATIGGGNRNRASSLGTVGGGEDNTATGYGATVGGGIGNTAAGSATVGGGDYNTAGQIYSTVGGGERNTANMQHSTVGGGSYNTATGLYSGHATVGGGYADTASGDGSTIGGGSYNTASGNHAFVGGGGSNMAGGLFATISGGSADTVAGDYSFASGRQVRLTSDADYSFGFGYNFTTSTPNAVIFCHPSSATRVGINKTDPAYAIDLPNNADVSGRGRANSWTTYSSIRWKETINPIDHALDKVLALRGVYFDWRNGKKHDIGMIAEEVGKVIPEVVAYEENGVDAQALDYARLTALLVEAIKAQQDEIDALKAKLEKIQSNR